MPLIKGRLKEIVERSDTPAERAFDFTIQGLIVFSLVTFSLETLPDLSPRASGFLHKAEVVTVAIFTLEYLLRLAVADRPLRYAFSFFGLVDLLAILPFYLAQGIDLRALRTLRFLRLFRLLKLMRYSKAISRFRLAISLVREELVMFTGVTLLLLYLSAVGIYYFEREAQPEAFSSVFDSLWWAVSTLTTVGYGDLYPVTTGGRVFTFVVLMLGLGVVAVPCGLLASALSEARRLERAQNSPAGEHEHEVGPLLLPDGF